MQDMRHLLLVKFESPRDNLIICGPILIKRIECIISCDEVFNKIPLDIVPFGLKGLSMAIHITFRLVFVVVQCNIMPKRQLFPLNILQVFCGHVQKQKMINMLFFFQIDDPILPPLSGHVHATLNNT